MSLRRYTPNPLLTSRIAGIVVTESAAGEVPILPVPGAVLGVQFRGRVFAEQGPLSPAGVTGIQSSARRFVHPEPTGSVLVRFTSQGAASLGIAPEELRERSVSIEDILGRARSAELCERVCEAPDDRTRVLLVEEFLLQLPYAYDALVGRATALLTRDGLSVAQTALQLGVSERQLERRFRSRVGVSPKQFSRISRFERALLIANAPSSATSDAVGDVFAQSAPSLAAIALRAGYYDQSHLVRDAREFANQTPRQLFSRLRDDVGFFQDPPSPARQIESKETDDAHGPVHGNSQDPTISPRKTR